LGGFLKHAGARRKHAETAIEAGIAGIAGSKVTNQWGIKGFLYRGSGNSVSNYLISLGRWAAGGEPPFRADLFLTQSPVPPGLGTDGAELDRGADIAHIQAARRGRNEFGATCVTGVPWKFI
jgi:hypothetical protein